MIRLLVANGDSYTQGAGLDDPSTQAWPTLLADLLGAAYVNLARFGSSNRRTVRSTVQRLDGLRAEHAVAPGEVLVLTAWTEFQRHEYHSGTERFDPRDHPADRGWHRMGRWRHGVGHAPTDAFFDHLWSQEGEATGFFLDWLLLDRYLHAGGYQARYAFTFPRTGPPPEQARGLVAQLPAAGVLGGLPQTAGSSFAELSDGCPRTEDGHPMAEGHARFAETLAAWIGR